LPLGPAVIGGMRSAAFSAAKDFTAGTSLAYGIRRTERLPERPWKPSPRNLHNTGLQAKAMPWPKCLWPVALTSRRRHRSGKHSKHWRSASTRRAAFSRTSLSLPRTFDRSRRCAGCRGTPGSRSPPRVTESPLPAKFLPAGFFLPAVFARLASPLRGAPAPWLKRRGRIGLSLAYAGRRVGRLPFSPASHPRCAGPLLRGSNGAAALDCPWRMRGGALAACRFRPPRIPAARGPCSVAQTARPHWTVAGVCGAAHWPPAVFARLASPLRGAPAPWLKRRGRFGLSLAYAGRRVGRLPFSPASHPRCAGPLLRGSNGAAALDCPWRMRGGALAACRFRPPRIPAARGPCSVAQTATGALIGGWHW